MSSSDDKYFDSVEKNEETPFKIKSSVESRCRELDDLHMLCYPEDSIKYARVNNYNQEKIIAREI